MEHITSCVQNNDKGFCHVKSPAVERQYPSSPKSGCRTFKADDEHCSVIGKALLGSQNTQLTALDLSDGKIGDEGASCLAEGLACSSVTRLDLSHNSVGGRGVGALGDLLGSDPALEVLILSKQRREARTGMAQLAAGLAVNTRLRELWLASLKLGNQDCVALAGALATNTGVTVLDLCGNRIEVAGSAAVADMLKRNCKLEQLALDGNPMGDQCIGVLAVALGANHTLRKLSLLNMSCGPKAYQALEQGLERNTHLERLAFSVAVTRDQASPGPAGPSHQPAITDHALTLPMQQQLSAAARHRKRRRWLFQGFLMGLHPRAGAESPVLWLPLQAVETIHSLWHPEMEHSEVQARCAVGAGSVGLRMPPGGLRRRPGGLAAWPPAGVG